MRSPRKRISPDVGSSAPTRQEKRVVLPAPFGAMIPKMSLCMTSKSTDASASNPPKRLLMPRAARMVSVGNGNPRFKQRSQSASNSHEAIRFVEHDDNQQSAVNEQKGIAKERNRKELDLQRAEDKRAKYRADDRAEAAQDRHQDDAQAEAKVENRAGRDVLEVDRVQTSRHCHHGRRQRVRGELETGGVD